MRRRQTPSPADGAAPLGNESRPVGRARSALIRHEVARKVGPVIGQAATAGLVVGVLLGLALGLALVALMHHPAGDPGAL